MKTLFILTSIITLFSACNKKTSLLLNDEEKNRSFMAFFRTQANTGNANDPYGCKVVNTNDVYLVWNGIHEAAGYRLKMKIQSGSWDRPEDILWDTIVGPDILKIVKEDLQYSTKHNFAIQTLSPKGEAYHSKWYGMGDSGHNDDRAEFETGERPLVPDVLSVSDVTETTMRVWFDVKVYDASPNKLNPSFQHESGKFLIDEILVEPASVNRDLPSKKITVTEQDINKGYVDVVGLTTNAMYVVNALNNNIIRYWDRLYDTEMIRMKGEVGEPILIKHIVDGTNKYGRDNNGSRLDTILSKYLFDSSLAEGTIFELEAGKVYFINQTLVIAKGFVLRSNDPTKKAIVHLRGVNETGAATFPNLELGRQAQAGEIGGIRVGDVIFDNISFEVPGAVSAFDLALNGGSKTGNYFINQHSAAMEFNCSRLEVKNCIFQGMVRGWFRTQGTNRQVIENIIIEDCIFHNMSMYEINGRGYSFITGAATRPNTNIFNNVVIKRNSFIGVCYDLMLRETVNLNWSSNVRWNITMENNTFLNSFSESSGRYLIQLQYPPANSSFTVKKNLFIAVKKENEFRPFTQSGMDFRSYNNLSFDVVDNYSTSRLSADGRVTYYGGANTTDIVTQQPFTHPSRGVSTFNKEGVDAAKVITGTNPIAPENLMVNPYAKGVYSTNNTWTSTVHQYDLNGLRFKNTPEVQNHPIYTKGIGDPRWR